jgi:hypothetical protein
MKNGVMEYWSVGVLERWLAVTLFVALHLSSLVSGQWSRVGSELRCSMFDVGCSMFAPVDVQGLEKGHGVFSKAWKREI